MKAHGAMSDIRCTRGIIRLILDRYITSPRGGENA